MNGFEKLKIVSSRVMLTVIEVGDNMTIAKKLENQCLQINISRPIFILTPGIKYQESIKPICIGGGGFKGPPACFLHAAREINDVT